MGFFNDLLKNHVFEFKAARSGVRVCACVRGRARRCVCVCARARADVCVWACTHAQCAHTCRARAHAHTHVCATSSSRGSGEVFSGLYDVVYVGG